MRTAAEVIGVGVALAGCYALYYAIAKYNPQAPGWDFFRDGFF
jgi:hypothetical protein